MEMNQPFIDVVNKHKEPKKPQRPGAEAYQVVNQPQPQPKPQPRPQPPQRLVKPKAPAQVPIPAELFSEDSNFEITSSKMLVFSEYLLRSGLVPTTFQNPGHVCMAVQVAISLGYKKYGDAIRAISNMYVYQNKVMLFGDLPLALVKRSGKLEWIKEFFVDSEGKSISFENKNLEEFPSVAVCIVKRTDSSAPYEETITSHDLERSGIVIRDGMFNGGKGKFDVWSQHPKVMWKRRCRARALKSVFPDVLIGTELDVESGKAQVVHQQHEPEQFVETI